MAIRPRGIEQIHVEHWAIIDAIAARDVAAAEHAARIHCVRSCEDMLSRYKGFSPDQLN